MSALSRRQVFLSGGAVAGLCSLPGANSAHPDSALIAACSDLEQLALRMAALYLTIPDDVTFETEEAFYEAHIDPLSDEMSAISEAVIYKSATTMQGVLARARALAVRDPAMVDPDGECNNGVADSIARATIRDLLAVAGGAA